MVSTRGADGSPDGARTGFQVCARVGWEGQKGVHMKSDVSHLREKVDADRAMECRILMPGLVSSPQNTLTVQRARFHSGASGHHHTIGSEGLIGSASGTVPVSLAAAKQAGSG
jgi:hypothetical protein